jgi:hypothetical protein
MATTWTEIANASVSVGAPGSTSLLTALRDNARAAAEEGTNAPYIARLLHPYDSNDVGDSDGEIWSFSTDGAVAVIETPEFEAGYDYGFWFENVEQSDIANQSVTAQAYLQVADDWAGSFCFNEIFNPSGNTHNGGFFVIYRPMQLARHHVLACEGIISRSGTSAPIGAMWTTEGTIYETVQERITKLRWRVDAGTYNFSAGRLLMYRRKVYY